MMPSGGERKAAGPGEDKTGGADKSELEGGNGGDGKQVPQPDSPSARRKVCGTGAMRLMGP